MTEQEAIKNFQGENKILSQYAETEFQRQVFAEKIERNNIAIKALEVIQVLTKRNMTTEDIKNYAQFEDECVKKNFTFESLLEAREKQIPKKPIDRCMFKECPNCGEIEIQYQNHCPMCGQKLDWGEEE